MRLPFQEKEPEPKSLWSIGSSSSSSSSRNKKALAKESSFWAAPGSTSSRRQLSTGRRKSQKQVTPAPKKKSTSSSQNKRAKSAPKPPPPQKQKEKPPAQSQTRALVPIGIRKPSRRNKSFLDQMEEAICRWCESVESSGLYYCTAYPVHWIMGDSTSKRRRILVPTHRVSN